MRWDRKAFLRPVAHRGLHDATAGIIENSKSAFDAAIENDFAIECDIQCTKDNVPVVFHDFTLDRLMKAKGKVADIKWRELSTLKFKELDQTIMTFEAFLDHIAGRVPLLVELKSDWQPPRAEWLTSICQHSARYAGPLAIMSFDPGVLLALKSLEPQVPRGLISGAYRKAGRDCWWPDTIDEPRAEDLTNLRAIDTVQPDLIAYCVADLECAAVKRARDELWLPVFAWTVRSQQDWELYHRFADAPVFEGTIPTEMRS